MGEVRARITRTPIDQQGKLEEEEGQWPNKHIIPGIEFDANSLCVRLPDAKIAGARILFGGLLEDNGSRILCVAVLQQVRGVMQHFKSVNVIWSLLTAPVDALMFFGDEKNSYVLRPDKQIWGDFWSTVELSESHLQSETTRRNLSE